MIAAALELILSIWLFMGCARGNAPSQTHPEGIPSGEGYRPVQYSAEALVLGSSDTAYIETRRNFYADGRQVKTVPA